MKNIITDYGAVPGGVMDCTPAFAAALAVGGAIAVPQGLYRVTGATDACMVATLPTRLIGDGQGLSIISPDSHTVLGVDCLTFRPAVGGTCEGWGVQDLMITPAVGSGMRHAVRVDLTASGAYLARASFLRNSLIAGAMADSAFRLDNPANVDGMFCCEIAGKGVIIGGISMYGLGDSVSIRDQTITGPNVGVTLSGVPGAAQVRVEDCNITSAGGAAFFQGMRQLQFVGNQCEQNVAYTGVLGAMVTLSACYDCNIKDSNLNTHGLLSCVIIENGGSLGNILRANNLMAASPYAHLAVGAGCPGNAFASDNRCYNIAGVWGAPLLAVSGSSPLWTL